MTDVADILDRRHVIPGIRAHDKRALLEDLGRRAALALKSGDAQIALALMERERLGSTGVGHGVAIPHARIAGLAQTFGMFARAEPPVDYDAIDGQPVDLIFLLLAPAVEGTGHLSALAAVSRRLRDPAIANGVRRAENAREIHAILTGQP